jgi:acetyltransferase-like isoleucine patch superfamily enzyme
VSLRDAAKAIARGAATVAVSPALLSYAIRRPVIGADRALEGSTQALGLIPGLLGQYLRRAFLARVLAHCAPSAAIAFGTTFSAPGARIDDGVYIGPQCHIGLAHIERDVIIAPAVHIPSGGRVHAFDDPDVPIRDQPGAHELVRIGQGAWIGAAAVVMAHVGRGTVVASGAVVTKPLPDYVVAAGVPARVLRTRGRTTTPEGVPAIGQAVG